MSENVEKKKKFFDGIIPEMKSFYKKELKTKHMWNFAIAIFLYFAMIITVMFDLFPIDDILTDYMKDKLSKDIYSTDVYLEEVMVYADQIASEIETAPKATRFDAIKQQLALTFVTVFVGLTPYVPISVLVTVAYPIITAINVSGHSIIIAILMTLLVIIEIFLVTLVVAIGMYWCKMSTKHFRYNQSTSLTFNDVRLEFNEAMKKTEKVEEIKKKMEEKYEKVKLLNEKTNYKGIFVFTILCAVLLTVLTLITGV